MKWTNTIKAVKRGDSHQWEIGDALISDVRDHRANFSECSKQLKGLGFAYTDKYLKSLHLTATRFPKAKRDQQIAWDAHREATNSENLQRAAKELREIGKTISTENVGWIMNEWRKHAEKQRNKKKADAKERVRRAGKKKADAGRKKLSAKSDEEKKAAQAEFAEAKEEVKEAIEQFQLIPTEPIGHDEALDPEAMPPKGDLQILALFLKIESNAKLMLKTIESDTEALGPELDRASAANLAMIIKRYVEIKAAVDNLLVQVRKHGFKIVQGGVA